MEEKKMGVVVKAFEEKGVKIPAPYERIIKVLMAPDKHGISEVTFTFALIYPYSQTDKHTHDRPELIYVVSGRGEATLGDKENIALEPDIVFWAEADEIHQVRNTGDEQMKLATIFIPAYTAEELTAGILKTAKDAQVNK